MADNTVMSKNEFAGHWVRNFGKLLKLAYRNLFRNRRRSLFAVLIAASGLET